MAKTKAAAPEAPAVEPVEPAEDQQPVEPIAPAEPEPADEQPASAPELIKARILAACEHGAPNDVVELPTAEAKALAGIVDPDPAAVAYAESLK